MHSLVLITIHVQIELRFNRICLIIFVLLSNGEFSGNNKNVFYQISHFTKKKILIKVNFYETHEISLCNVFGFYMV